MKSKTGVWRTLHPVLDDDQCKGCWWIRSSLCPDGAIGVAEGRPVVDYDHCKGCMACISACPAHANLARAEHAAAPKETPA
ncbi:MAG: 4Fe-4S binding protein [Chromatiaceae bacterium]|nr:4Fe-4S binding protein [Chromatiaceae bacterium]